MAENHRQEKEYGFIRKQGIALTIAVTIDDDNDDDIVADSILCIVTKRRIKEAGGCSSLIQQKPSSPQDLGNSGAPRAGLSTQLRRQRRHLTTAVQPLSLIWVCAAALSRSSCCLDPTYLGTAARPATLHNPRTAPAFSNVVNSEKQIYCNEPILLRTTPRRFESLRPRPPRLPISCLVPVYV